MVNIATTGHKLQGMSMDYIIVVSWFYTVKNWVYVVLSRVRKLSGLFLFKPLDFNKYYKEDIKLKVHMKELEEKEKITLSSVKKISKMSYALKKNSTHKSKTISNSMLSKSKPENIYDQNIKAIQPKQTSTTTLKRKIKPKPKPVTNIDNMAKSDNCTRYHNIHPTLVQAQYILHDEVWGPRSGAHSLPSLSQVNRLKAKESCTSVTNIPGPPYTYTVGSCVFDSTIFCLSRSKYYTEVTKYTNGPDLRAKLYAWALTTLTSNENDTLSDMAATYIDKRGMLMDANAGVMENDEMKVIIECSTFVEYVLYMQINTEKCALEYDLGSLTYF